MQMFLQVESFRFMSCKMQFDPFVLHDFCYIQIFMGFLELG